MTVYRKRNKLKNERLNIFLDTELKQRLYDTAEHTGTAASELVRQAIRKELEHYSKHKDKNSL